MSLNQQAAELVLQFLHFAGEARQQVVDVAHLRIVRDGARHLHRKAEALRHTVGPARIGLGLVRLVEGRIDFHHREHGGIAFEVAAGRRESGGCFFRDVPAGATDEGRGIALFFH
jgi:hypothetical protein